MPKYYDFKSCGYYLYKDMYLKWSSISENGYYGDKN